MQNTVVLFTTVWCTFHTLIVKSIIIKKSCKQMKSDFSRSLLHSTSPLSQISYSKVTFTFFAPSYCRTFFVTCLQRNILWREDRAENKIQRSINEKLINKSALFVCWPVTFKSTYQADKNLFHWGRNFFFVKRGSVSYEIHSAEPLFIERSS